MSGHGPIQTIPLISDEHVAFRVRGDYANLAGLSDRLAYGTDGVFAPSSQWTMTSASVNFQQQGVAAQNVIHLTGPRTAFPGSGGVYFAVDSVANNAVTLRMLGQQLGIGQPPVSTAGVSGVTFTVATFANLIDVASYELKIRFGIDDANFFRSTVYIYNGVEDKYRCLQDAVVFNVIMNAYQSDARSEKGDWAMKLKNYTRKYESALSRVEVQWGSIGDAQESTDLFSANVCR